MNLIMDEHFAEKFDLLVALNEKSGYHQSHGIMELCPVAVEIFCFGQKCL